MNWNLDILKLQFNRSLQEFLVEFYDYFTIFIRFYKVVYFSETAQNYEITPVFNLSTEPPPGRLPHLQIAILATIPDGDGLNG